MSPLKTMLFATLACLALSACATRSSSPAAVGTTTTTSTLLCPSGYVPASDGKTCVLAPLPPY
jgi:hypothetical protein